MNEFIVIDVMNEAKIATLEGKKENCEINLEIREKLKDEALFFKIKEDEAYNLLKNVGIKQEKIKEIYKKLISCNVYYNLLNKGKITENDENLIIKYKENNYEDIFKKKNK